MQADPRGIRPAIGTISNQWESRYFRMIPDLVKAPRERGRFSIKHGALDLLNLEKGLCGLTVDRSSDLNGGE